MRRPGTLRDGATTRAGWWDSRPLSPKALFATCFAAWECMLLRLACARFPSSQIRPARFSLTALASSSSAESWTHLESHCGVRVHRHGGTTHTPRRSADCFSMSRDTNASYADTSSVQISCGIMSHSACSNRHCAIAGPLRAGDRATGGRGLPVGSLGGQAQRRRASGASARAAEHCQRWPCCADSGSASRSLRLLDHSACSHGDRLGRGCGVRSACDAAADSSGGSGGHAGT